MVNKLRGHGNRSVWGLVDWDRGTESTAFVKVLSAGRRYAIENLLLDPLLVTALVIDADDATDIGRLGLERTQSISALVEADAHEKRQEVIRSVQRLVPAEPSIASGTVEVVYFGGFSHEVSTAYLQRRGHDLAKQLLDVFPSLKKHRIERYLVDRSIKILKEHPQLLPRELLDVLNELLEPEH